MNRALGELSHSMPGSRWHGALDALTALNKDPGESPPEYTARGEALDRAAFLLGAEVVAALHIRSPLLADAIRQILVLGPDPDARIEKWLRESLALREFDFGEPSFVAPTPGDAEALWEQLRDHSRGATRN